MGSIKYSTTRNLLIMTRRWKNRKKSWKSRVKC